MLHSADSPDGPFRAGSVESALCRTEVLQGIYPGSFSAQCCSPFGRHWRICCYWSDATPLFVKLPGAPGREAKGLRHLFLEGRPLFQGLSGRGDGFMASLQDWPPPVPCLPFLPLTLRE